ncbi:MAG: hypothetical protein AAF755_09540 [Pseudomonadota bacterium]
MLLKLSRVTALALLTSFSSQTAAEADPRPSLVDVLSIDRLGTFTVNQFVVALRTQAEFEYEFASADLLRGRFAFSGVTLSPALAYGKPGACSITVDRMSVEANLGQLMSETLRAQVGFLGVDISEACFPGDWGEMMAEFNLAEISLDQANFTVAYSMPTGETSLRFTTHIRDVALIDASASGMLLPRRIGSRLTEPAIRLKRAAISLKDDGGWDSFVQALPQNMRNPIGLRGLATQALVRILLPGDAGQISEMEQLFIDDFSTAVAIFVGEDVPGAEPRSEFPELVFETDLPEEGVVLEPELYRNPSDDLVGAVALRARTTSLARERILDDALLSAAIAPPDDLTDTQRLTLAKALLRGRGIPQAPDRIPALLEPMFGASEQGAEAALLAAQALEQRDPERAYVLAMLAGSYGEARAVAMLDRLEQKIDTRTILRLQESEGNDVRAFSIVLDSDPRALRDQALAHLTGVRLPRSYAEAYYYALLGEAAGDTAASSLKEEIENRFAARGSAVAETWAALRSELQSDALEDWVNGGLADKYRSSRP